MNLGCWNRKFRDRSLRLRANGRTTGLEHIAKLDRTSDGMSVMARGDDWIAIPARIELAPIPDHAGGLPIARFSSARRISFGGPGSLRAMGLKHIAKLDRRSDGKHLVAWTETQPWLFLKEPLSIDMCQRVRRMISRRVVAPKDCSWAL